MMFLVQLDGGKELNNSDIGCGIAGEETDMSSVAFICALVVAHAAAAPMTTGVDQVRVDGGRGPALSDDRPSP